MKHWDEIPGEKRTEAGRSLERLLERLTAADPNDPKKRLTDFVTSLREEARDLLLSVGPEEGRASVRCIRDFVVGVAVAHAVSEKRSPYETIMAAFSVLPDERRTPAGQIQAEALSHMADAMAADDAIMFEAAIGVAHAAANNPCSPDESYLVSHFARTFAKAIREFASEEEARKSRAEMN